MYVTISPLIKLFLHQPKIHTAAPFNITLLECTHKLSTQFINTIIIC